MTINVQFLNLRMIVHSVIYACLVHSVINACFNDMIKKNTFL